MSDVSASSLACPSRCCGDAVLDGGEARVVQGISGKDLPAPMACIPDLMRRLRSMGDADYLLYLIAYHAAPTLLGIKPATLVCPDPKGRDLERALDECVPCLARMFGVKVVGFRNRAGARLYLVYRPALLEAVLANREARELLAGVGYGSTDGGLEDVFGVLRRRCRGACFPHEIGVFLGYPAEDVRGFMTDGGKGCRVTGCWKAYSDEEQARRRSRRFRLAKLRAAELIVGGADLTGVADGLRALAA